MREVQRHIKEATMELETDDFIWFFAGAGRMVQQ